MVLFNVLEYTDKSIIDILSPVKKQKRLIQDVVLEALLGKDDVVNKRV
jgi:hypothetical protein